MLKIDKEIVTNLKQRFVTLTDIAYLYSIVHEDDWGIVLDSDSMNRLIALGYIDKFELSPTSEAVLLVGICTGQQEDVELSSFEEFWELYPASDAWGGFSKTRNIKTRRGDALGEYRILIRSGVTAQEINLGLNTYIHSLKAKSTFGNALKFMVGPQRFLKEKMFRTHTDIDEEVYDKITR